MWVRPTKQSIQSNKSLSSPKPKTLVCIIQSNTNPVRITRKIPSTMASHHHHPAHQYHHCPPATTTSSTVCYCYYCCTDYTPSYHHPPPPPANFYSPYPHVPNANPPYTTLAHHRHEQPHYHPPSADLEKERYFHKLHHDQQRELTHNHPTVSSLISRIAALESSLRHHPSSRSHPLRDAAARTIQTHFRALLVRRSRTLRQLKDLASIKSTLNILKSSVSEDLHFDPQSLFREALKLLFKLDSVQGGDPMIRDGKKSISREITRFLDVIDGVTLKKSEISARLVKKNVARKCGALHNDQKRGNVNHRTNLMRSKKRLEDLVDRIDALSTKVTVEDDMEDEEDLEISDISQTKTGRLGKKDDGIGGEMKMRVSFVENGKVYKVHRNRYEPVSAADYDDSDSVGANGELEENVPRKTEDGGISFKENDDDDDDRSQDGESTKSSDGERGSLYASRNEDGSLNSLHPCL